MVARAEIDMLDIKAEFLKMYKKSLYSFIKVRDCLIFNEAVIKVICFSYIFSLIALMVFILCV